MRMWMTLFTALLLTGLSGCSAYEQHKKAADDLVNIMNDIATILESVKTQEDVAAASEKIEKLNGTMDELVKRINALPKISQSDDKKLENEINPKLQEATRRIEAAVQNLRSVTGSQQLLLKAGSLMMKLSAVKRS